MKSTISKKMFERDVIREIRVDRASAPAFVSFISLYRSMRFLYKRGFAWGSLDGDNPIPFMKGSYDIPQKWHNLTKEDKQRISGVIVSDDFILGDCKIIYFDNE